MTPKTPYKDALPPLKTQELEALRISCRDGIRTPCLVTEDDRLLDGHNRLAIDPDAPIEVVPGSGSWSDEECLAFIWRTNLERRNLSHEQWKEVRRRQQQTALALRRRDPTRYTQEVLASMFGVCQRTMSNWTGNNSNDAIISATDPPPDARVKVPPKERGRIFERCQAGEAQAQVAADYGITERTVRNIIASVREENEYREETVSTDACTVDDLAKLKGKNFGTIYADPPWQYGNQGTRAATDNHYETMTVEEIAALPIKELAAENAHLHLWTTNAFLFECPKIMAAWGFEYKSVLVWVKPTMGIGNYWRVSHEFLLLGVRGAADFRNRSKISWLQHDRADHSTKPHAFRQLVEEVSPGPRLELFGREPVNGWIVWGNQIKRGLFDDDVRRL